jgi:peroxiredoxin
VLPPDLTPPVMSAKMTEDEQRQAWQDYNRREEAFWRSEAGRQAERAQRAYALIFETNGAFRIENVPPGDYMLYVSPTNPERGDNYYENIGFLNKPVTIPEAASGAPDAPFDLGELEVQIRGTLRVGKRAPKFEAKTFDGRTVKLEDYKGKYVLLDFWATWAGTRTFDVQMLKGLHDAYGKDNRFVMLGLNFDNETNTPQATIAQTGLKWTQCYAGPWNQTRLAASFGIQGLPDAILIDPEGKGAARNLRGSSIRSTVRNVLAQPRTASAKP